MRLLFLLLLLGNLAFFAVNYFELDWGEKAPQSAGQLHPELIQLRDTGKAGAAANKMAAKTVPVKKRAPVKPKDNKLYCLEWGDFSGEDLKNTTAALAKLKLGKKLGQREVVQDTGFWVYMPPLRSKARVKKKIRELENLGVYEYYVISGKGRWKNSISLGIFKTRAAAQKLYKKLKAQGVRSAKMGERASKLISTQFILSGVNSKIKDKLTGLQQEFKGSELNDVSCSLTR